MEFSKYTLANAADHDWQDELIKEFGKQACNARYDARGKSTPKLAELHTKFQTASAAWRDEMETRRGSAPTGSAVNARAIGDESISG